MKLVKFMSREKLVEYLEEELRLFLNAEEIYDINQYGWLQDDRPDPEYMGFAMWQMEPPSARHKISNISGKPRPLSKKNSATIFKTGLAFKELMQSARHSIGLTYLYRNDYDNPCYCFNYHFSDAAMKLTLATDNLRKLFIDVFRVLPDLDIKGKNRSFCRPFQQTRDKLAENCDCYEELLACIDTLLPLVELISAHRKAGLTYHSEQLSTTNNISLITDNKETRTRKLKEQKSGLDGDTVTRGISDWYKLLIKTSNQVFMTEYLIRNYDSSLPMRHTVIAN